MNDQPKKRFSPQDFLKGVSAKDRQEMSIDGMIDEAVNAYVDGLSLFRVLVHGNETCDCGASSETHKNDFRDSYLYWQDGYHHHVSVLNAFAEALGTRNIIMLAAIHRDVMQTIDAVAHSLGALDVLFQLSQVAEIRDHFKSGAYIEGFDKAVYEVMATAARGTVGMQPGMNAVRTNFTPVLELIRAHRDKKGQKP